MDFDFLDLLWLALSIAGLGLLWLVIKWLEKLTQKIKLREDLRLADEQKIATRTADEEQKFMQAQAAKQYLAQGDIGELDADGKASPEFEAAISALSGKEFIDSVVERIYGDPQDVATITATKTPFDNKQTPSKVAVAGGNGVTPAKAKPSRKTALSKSEQKMLKKIQQEG